jgi:hypothetical protein
MDKLSDNIFLLERPKISRGRVIVDGDVNIDISSTRGLEEIVKPENIIAWLEMARVRIVNTMLYDEVETGDDA